MPWEKQFDVEKARQAALTVFWTRGYENTSMPDLLEAMGIQRGSFYDTFKSKHHALMDALHGYDSVRRRTFLSANCAGKSPLQVIGSLFSAVAAEAASESGRRGCFLVNCALELAPRDPAVAAVVNRAFDETRAFFSAMIKEGQQSGEIPCRIDPEGVAQALLGLLLGMRVLARAGTEQAAVEAIAEQAQALMR